MIQNPGNVNLSSPGNRRSSRPRRLQSSKSSDVVSVIAHVCVVEPFRGKESEGLMTCPHGSEMPIMSVAGGCVA